MTPTVLHDATAHKFYISFPEGEAALSYAMVDDNTLDFYSTFVPPELRGRKIAQMLVEAGFAYAKEHHFQVIPSCPYVKVYLERHPQ
ncbi:MAG: GNAT family N-acetyltransferase [Gammaproteobacteria bacterium]|jgi:predicted GNAT family acetyltransferase